MSNTEKILFNDTSFKSYLFTYRNTSIDDHQRITCTLTDENSATQRRKSVSATKATCTSR
ncbi:MAG: hypothetical protein LBR66_02460 [Candidatus Symbiothrix sp.]|nr:hypothetical protein [Candidatus Symbiothrix sp.]